MINFNIDNNEHMTLAQLQQVNRFISTLEQGQNITVEMSDIFDDDVNVWSDECSTSFGTDGTQYATIGE